MGVALKWCGQCGWAVTLPADLVALVDAARGRESRGQFIRRVLLAEATAPATGQVR